MFQGIHSNSFGIVRAITIVMEDVIKEINATMSTIMICMHLNTVFIAVKTVKPLGVNLLVVLTVEGNGIIVILMDVRIKQDIRTLERTCQTSEDGVNYRRIACLERFSLRAAKIIALGLMP